MKNTLVFASALSFALAAAAAEPGSVVLGDDGSGHEVPAGLWGIFFEDINWAADGGLNPELLANGGFDWGQADHQNNPKDDVAWNCRDDGWEPDFRDGGMARLSFQYNTPVHPNTAKHLRIEGFGTGKAGVRNRGYDGIFIKEGEEYLLTLDWRELVKDGIDYADAPWNRNFKWNFTIGEGQLVKGFCCGQSFELSVEKDDKAADGRWMVSVLNAANLSPKEHFRRSVMEYEHS